MTTIWVYEWADEGGPGGHVVHYQLVTENGRQWLIPLDDSGDRLAWPNHFISLGPTVYARAWRHCVHAPDDPLFD